MENMETRQELLRMERISKSFSGVQVLKDVDLTLYQGEVLGLVGENGAGKSTLMNLLTSVFPKDTGNITYKGQPFLPRNSLEAQIAGISFIHQELDLFSNLSVMENMFIELMPTKFGFVADRAKMKQIAQKAIDEVGGGLELNTLVENLEMGKRQLLEIAKALSKNASIIIFDEPTTSLSASEKQKLFEVIESLRAKGTSIIYISHHLDEVFRLCNRIMVMRNGQNVITLDNQNLTKEQLIAYMVGRELGAVYPYIEKHPGDVVLRANHLARGSEVQDVSFEVRKGEVVGMFGLMGAGRSEMLRAVFGLDPIDGGTVEVKGKLVDHPTPQKSIALGMAFLTENRRSEGLFLDKTVTNNLMIANLKEMSNKFGFMDDHESDKMSRDMVERLMIKTYNKDVQVTRKLSGGNQQKIVIGKWLMIKPDIFLLDEPTRGIDVGAKREIYELINDLASDGSTIFMVSSEMEELMGVCDRILVMHKGRISGEVQRADFNQQRILNLAFGVKEAE